ncbi:hypothetical protein EKO27_g4666 [Xylaria grammica]|uniref:CRAL-TRIO domain-containing protein n=1 Tax=Xylaria grammica TaxID=363999 RepID=A0A439D7P6_9PEZI|nr:hypothetical protein EKO27_g4666 [Xylaria grammica]
MTILEIEDKATMGQQRLLSLSDDPFTNPPEQPLKLDEMVRTWDKDGLFKKRLSKHYTQFYHKTDKDGRPCYFEKLGGIDFAKLRKEGFTNDQMILNLAVEYEKMVDSRLPACSRRAGRLVETSCSVLDANHLSFLDTEAIRNYIRQTSAMSNSNYPERLGKMYVINVPWSIKWLWGLIRNFLDPVTASKIHVLGYNYKAELLQQIPEENLPAMFGGKCNCEGGCELSDEGPWQEDEWKQPARREEPSDATIENKPTDIVTGDAAAVVEGEETKVAA